MISNSGLTKFTTVHIFARALIGQCMIHIISVVKLYISLLSQVRENLANIAVFKVQQQNIAYKSINNNEYTHTILFYS